MNKESSTSQVDKGRVIKFRVIEDGKVIGYERLNGHNWEWMFLAINPDKGERWSPGVFPPCQEILKRDAFTGLLDERGKEVYDQDILSLWCQTDPTEYEMKALVYWDNDRLGWCIKCYQPSGHISTESLMEIAGEPEFIVSSGNIHQDKHLLK